MARRETARPPKNKKPPKPNLPQHDFADPYARLMTLGDDDPEEVYEAIAKELRASDAEAAAVKLLEMALDETYYEYDDEESLEDDPRGFTRTHTLRVLQRMGDAAQIAIRPLLPLLAEDEDDWVSEEMPFFYAAMGEPAIEPLTELLRDPDADVVARVGAGDSLAQMAEDRPELRTQIVPILEQALALEPSDAEMTACVIGNLLDINSVDSVPLIRQAFLDGRVDETIIEMADVEEHFDLPRESPRRPWNELLADGEEYDEDDTGDWIPLGNGGESASEMPQEPYVAPLKVGRNDPCPCGSGKKYKKCCGAA